MEVSKISHHCSKLNSCEMLQKVISIPLVGHFGSIEDI